MAMPTIYQTGSPLVLQNGLICLMIHLPPKKNTAEVPLPRDVAYHGIESLLSTINISHT